MFDKQYRFKGRHALRVDQLTGVFDELSKYCSIKKNGRRTCCFFSTDVFEMKKVFVLICIRFYVVIALTNKEKYIFLLVI